MSPPARRPSSVVRRALVGVATLAVGGAYPLVALVALSERGPGGFGPGCELEARLVVLALGVQSAGAIAGVVVGRRRGAEAGLTTAVVLLAVAAGAVVGGFAWIRHAHSLCTPFPPHGYVW